VPKVEVQYPKNPVLVFITLLICSEPLRAEQCIRSFYLIFIPKPGVRRQREQCERGAVVVESGLIIVPLLAIFFLIADISFAIFTKATLQHAVREGVRYAVTGRTLGAMHQDASIKSMVKDWSLGLLWNQDSKVVIRYYKPDTLEETESNAAGNVVEVSVEGYQYVPLAAILHSAGPIGLTVRSSDVVEPSAGGTAPPR
jgi:hypothetical protein